MASNLLALSAFSHSLNLNTASVLSLLKAASAWYARASASARWSWIWGFTKTQHFGCKPSGILGTISYRACMGPSSHGSSVPPRYVQLVQLAMSVRIAMLNQEVQTLQATKESRERWEIKGHCLFGALDALVKVLVQWLHSAKGLKHCCLRQGWKWLKAAESFSLIAHSG